MTFTKLGLHIFGVDVNGLGNKFKFLVELSQIILKNSTIFDLTNEFTYKVCM